MSSITRTRVQDHTDEEINRQIHRRIRRNIEYYAQYPEGINRRLRELDREWDIERMLEVNSAGLSLFGLMMGITGRKSWLLLPLAVQSFFLQHALQGWCPPLPLLRRQGFRTADEINYERHALKALRGDYAGVSQEKSRENAEEAAEQILEAAIH